MELSPTAASVQFASGSESDVSQSLINKICGAYSGGLRFAAPIVSLQTNEFELVRGVLHMLQGFSSSVFHWVQIEQSYCAKSGIYVSHLSHASLHGILDQFIYAATCLQLVEIVLNKVERSGGSTPPTLRAFACSVSAWLRRLRDIALKEEGKIINSESRTAPTLLGLASSLSSLCSGAEYLLHIVQGAIPQVYFECDPPVPATNIAAHILDHLYKKFNEVCHVQGGEEDAYRMLFYIFIGSLLPYIEGIDSWIFEGTLDDPFEEMFFYANKAIAIDEAEFWEKSYLLRPTQVGNLDVAHATTPQTLAEKGTKARESTSASVPAKGKGRNERDLQACPLFMKDMAKEIISAGKSLQLIQYAPTASSAVFGNYQETAQSMSQLTLSEVFCLSLTALIGHGDHMSEFFWQDDGVVSVIEALGRKEKLDHIPDVTFSEKIWFKFLVDTLPLKAEFDVKSVQNDASADMKREIIAVDIMGELPLVTSFCPENPAITVCHRLLHENSDAWDTLNLLKNFYLPPLNDEDLRTAVFGGNSGPIMETKGTNYSFGSSFGASEHARSKDDTKMLEVLFPFPNLLPSFKEDLHVSELLPFQKNSTIVSRVLSWVLVVEPKATPLPVVILQECLIFYIKKQVDKIGRQILSKLLYDWRLMDELGVLRAIYLLGSGDLLQHFFTVIFNKLDKGESWDDDFELNTVLQKLGLLERKILPVSFSAITGASCDGDTSPKLLQSLSLESIRNSADGTLLSAPDSLVVSMTNNHGSSGYEQHNTSFLASPPRKSRGQSSGIDGLNFLKFSYKVSWPLELIANNEALKKYNQVMIFLLKVKRAKFVLDKARRWMWKDRGTATVNRKRHWLLEQKLLHFVDAFHLYVMDRVYHSAWRELCEGMSAAGSLDEVIEVHDAYLLSIQRQCFVVPDKLWALIASRINSILGLALDFSSIQQTLSSGGGAVSAIKARCEMEVDRIEKQFDDCIAFLLRVLSFKLNVGHFPHLADLVTRINYNYFYMSDSGNLKTIPGSDTPASKLGKASVGTN